MLEIVLTCAVCSYMRREIVKVSPVASVDTLVPGAGHLGTGHYCRTYFQGGG